MTMLSREVAAHGIEHRPTPGHRTCGGVRTLHVAPFNLWHSSGLPANPCASPLVPERRRTVVRATATTLAPPKQETKAASKGKKVLVRMSVPYRVAFGEIIKVVGSGPFGDWDVMTAPRFDWTEGDIWMGNLMLDPGEYEYKVVIYNERTQAARWESNANRVVKVPEGPGTLTVSCYWNAPSTEGWFDKGDPDPFVKLAAPDVATTGRRRPPSPEPSMMLSKGWEEMLTRSGSPEPSRSRSSPQPSRSSPQPSRGSPQPSRGTPTPSTSGREAGAGMSWAPKSSSSAARGVGISRANKWASALEEGLADENAERRGLAKPVRRSMPSTITRESIENMLRERELLKEREREKGREKDRETGSVERGKEKDWTAVLKSVTKEKDSERSWSVPSSVSSKTSSSKSSSSSSSSSGGDGGKGKGGYEGGTSSWSHAKEEFGELTESGEKMMKNFSEMLSSRLNGVASLPESWSEGTLLHGGLKQLRGLDSRVMLNNMRDMVSSIANLDEVASFQRAASKVNKLSLTPALSRGEKLIVTEGEKLLKAVTSVVSTKSPSAIRGEYIDEETLRESYKTKPRLPTVTTRRPRLKSDTASYDAKWKAAKPSSTSSSSSSPPNKPSTRKPTPKIENPKIEFELPVNAIREDPSVLGGMAVVLAAVMTMLSTDAIKPTIMARSEAVRAALLEPMTPKISGRTPQPARGAVSPATKTQTAPKPGAAAEKPTAAAAKPAAAAQTPAKPAPAPAAAAQAPAKPAPAPAGDKASK